MAYSAEFGPLRHTPFFAVRRTLNSPSRRNHDSLHLLECEDPPVPRLDFMLVGEVTLGDPADAVAELLIIVIQI